MDVGRSVAGERQKIDSLQALRAFAFLGIFFRHAHFYIKWPGLGVSLFFVMSGFLMMYRYNDRDLNSSLKGNIRFAIQKIKKLYPLHIITMLFIIVLNVELMIRNGITLRTILELVGKVFLNITLMQTWFPNSNVNVSLNGVAWYLSVMLFLYFVFPYVQVYIKKSRLYKLCVICVLLLILQVISCIPFICLIGSGNPIYIWYMYCFPIFRVVEFFIGCVLAKLYLERNIKDIKASTALICEILAVVLTILGFLWMKMIQKNVLFLALQNWTTVWIPLAAIWIVLFAVNKGIITRLFVNKVFIYIGNISAYNFLIHYVVIQYAHRIIQLWKINVSGPKLYILVGIELMISVALSVLYKKIHEKIITYKKETRITS